MSIETDLRMGLENGKQRRFKASRAVENFCGHRDLADIVNHRTKMQSSEAVVIQAHGLTDFNGQLRNPLLMTGGIRVTFFNGQGNGANGLQQRGLQLLGKVFLLGLGLFAHGNVGQGSIGIA